MNTLIKDLSCELKKMFFANLDKQGDDSIVDESNDISWYITWSQCNEPSDFWGDLHYGKDVTHYKCYPKKRSNYYFY